MIEYLSPSRISTFYKSPKEFYLRYLCPHRPPPMLQTQPMAVGSAFDAYVKAWLYKSLYGSNDPKYSFAALFETQVEAHNRDWAKMAGAYAFSQYKELGALGDLLLMLQKAVGDARFEFEVRGVVNDGPEALARVVSDGEGHKPIVFLGKPDLAFDLANGTKVVLDWKVSGFCSKYGVSPMPGYVNLRGRKGGTTAHERASIGFKGSVKINKEPPSTYFNQDWLTQTCIYSWLLGIEVGSEFLIAIDQLACKPDLKDMPDIRVSEYRCVIPPEDQFAIYEKARHVWEVAHSDHFFRDLSYEESKDQEKALDTLATTLRDKGGDALDKWMADLERQSYNRPY